MRVARESQRNRLHDGSESRWFETCSVRALLYRESMLARSVYCLPHSTWCESVVSATNWIFIFFSSGNQSSETDIILTDGEGWNYNGSFELNYGKGGEIDVGVGSGG